MITGEEREEITDSPAGEGFPEAHEGVCLETEICDFLCSEFACCSL